MTTQVSSVSPTRTPGAAGRWAAGGALVVVTAGLTLLLARAAGSLPHLLGDYPAWQDQMYRRIPQFLRWFVGDTTEAQFFKTGLGGLGLLGGGWLAHVAAKRGSRWAGFPIAAGTGLWPWLTGAALAGLLLSDLVWGWTIPATGEWQPTFVAFVSVPPAIVLTYGRGWRVAATGAALGVLLPTPIAIGLVQFGCYPLGLPSVIGNVSGMWIGALVAFPLCRLLPWLPKPLAAPAAPVDPPRQGPVWVLRRVLADFTEAPFHGNELASAGLIAGTVVTFLLNPQTPVYGGGLLPALLATQVLTSTVGVLVYRRSWARHGWYPTFVPLVSVAPAVVLTYGATVQAVVIGAVLGALIAPPFAAFVSRKLPAVIHPFVGNVFSMAVCTLVIVPVLGLFPGFG